MGCISKAAAGERWGKREEGIGWSDKLRLLELIQETIQVKETSYTSVSELLTGQLLIRSNNTTLQT